MADEKRMNDRDRIVSAIESIEAHFEKQLSFISLGVLGQEKEIRC